MRVWRALTLLADDKDSPRPSILSLRLPPLPLPRAHALQASLRVCVRACMRAVGRFAEFWLPPL
jgi:hypothetical protein